MMITKSPPEVLTPEDPAYISTLSECERRHFLATRAIFFHKRGVSISKIMKTGKNTIYKGIRELQTNDGLREGRIRRKRWWSKESSEPASRVDDALKGVI